MYSTPANYSSPSKNILCFSSFFRAKLLTAAFVLFFSSDASLRYYRSLAVCCLGRVTLLAGVLLGSVARGSVDGVGSEGKISSKVVVMFERGWNSSSSLTYCRKWFLLEATASCPALRRVCLLLLDCQFISFYYYSMPKLVFCLVLLLVCRAATQCPSNCLLCLSQPICTLCSSGYALTMSGECTPKAISNCRVYASPSSCQICEASFLAIQGQCKKDPSGCLSRTYQGICQFCGFGTQLVGRACIGVLNCGAYDTSGTCTKCKNGYSLNQGKCLDQRPECVLQTAGVCTNCQVGYILNGFACIPQNVLPPNCELYSQEDGYCLVCSPGYQLQHRYCRRVDLLTSLPSPPTVTNALQMPQDILDGPTVTASRDLGSDNLLPFNYGVRISSFAGSGKVGSDNCWIKATDGNCKVCLEGYNLNEGQCAKLPPACLKYSANGTNCVQCAQALTLKEGSCVDTNCAVGIFSRCAVCKPPYQSNSEGICLNPNCTKLLSGQCQQCASGTTLTNDHLCLASTTSAVSNPSSAVSSTSAPTGPTGSASSSSSTSSSTGQGISHCQTEVGGVCVSCQEGYFPNGNGGCKRVIIGCLELDPQQENCVRCMVIYTLDSGNCLFPGQTPATPPTPVVSTPTVQADAIDPNCLIQNQGSCASCKDRYILNLYNFSCMAVDSQCQNYNKTDGKCLSCKVGFNFFEGWCLQTAKEKDPACQISNIYNYCITCAKAYYSLRGKCQPENSLCKSTEYRGGACLSCYNGYILYNGQCVELSKQPACLSYNFQSLCSQCKLRYALSAGVCLPVSPLCMNYDTSSGNCFSCINGYGVSTDTQKCVEAKAIPVNCAKADDTGKCTECSPRYFIDVQGNCALVAPLCDLYQKVGGKCLQCFEGYKLMGDSSCASNNLAQGCTSATKEGTCSSCLPQYVLDGKGGCLTRDPNCLEYQNGECLKCNYFFFISQGACKKETPKSKDANCLISDLYNYCQQCIQGYYTFEGNCKLVDQLCKGYNPTNGNCLGCYDGYRLSNNKCYLNTPIFHCQSFNGNICTKCEGGYSLKTDGSCS